MPQPARAEYVAPGRQSWGRCENDPSPERDGTKQMPEFLLEIGTEEIPARMIAYAQRDLKGRVSDLLVREHLSETGTVTSVDTPRRMAVLASDIFTSQPDAVEQVNGPSASVAFKAGEPA